ncbi:MAG: biopolymer transporter ExbD [Phycisphaeraceae bacterium]|nr:biopolymer transporter ExbD [Phycisphaeraceae bacterium]
MVHTPAASPHPPDDLVVGSSSEQAPEHEARRAGTAPHSTNMQLNLTSMIDVIFQLLIYFVITANFAVGEGVITAKLPASETGASTATPPEKPLNIVVSTAGQYGYRITLEGMPHAPRNFSDLAVLLARLQYGPANPTGSFKDDNPVLIKPDETVRWQHVVNAFNAAVKAKYKNISFAQTTSP